MTDDNGGAGAVFAVFALLSVMAVGGGAAVLPETHALVVERHHWMTADAFRDAYGLGQVVPGPNMLMVMVIGHQVAGLAGALAAIAGFFGPSSAIAWGAGRLWNRFAGSPWRAAVERGLAPLVVGLMAAGTIAVARTAIDGAATVAIAVAVFAGVLGLRRLNPALLVLAAGVVGLGLGLGG
ncbi:chromate transporter [Oharaeibacter diazotrophicus]|uniref:Chromate transporter n=1 Tax=Oharaeibacter diazotrophicus TaxID=1920512 RepID=A0A4R6RIT4_9HYPH|nr:chromate transporter [Oharaeibacter diazotrophicus]TDP85546.1 chromate transporter [Oharaeibacter diazotrophicus]BBE74517.1 chromate transport protein [Pleomorphomonas sp. SM30]GLS75784.1 chromate transporter [Oharaeibacter diazotrophicus]